MAGRKKGSFTQAGRILKLAELLEGSRLGFTVAELATRHDVTDRQMRRDLDLLDQAGYTLLATVADDGKTRYRLGPTRRRALMLTSRERYALLAVRRAFDVLLDTPLYEDVESIFGKIVGSLPEDERDELAAYGDRFVYLPEGGTKLYGAKDDVLDALLTGVLRRWRVAYTYRAAHGEAKKGVLEPYAMVLYKNGLYVVGASVATPAAETPRQPRVYACERFQDAEFQRGVAFEVPKTFRAERHFDGVFGIFMSDGEPKHVVIEFTAEARPLVEARTWHKTQKLTRLAGGGVRLELDVVDLTQVHTWALGWGPQARVLGPPELVERMKRELAAMRRMY